MKECIQERKRCSTRPVMATNGLSGLQVWLANWLAIRRFSICDSSIMITVIWNREVSMLWAQLILKIALIPCRRFVGVQLVAINVAWLIEFRNHQIPARDFPRECVTYKPWHMTNQSTCQHVIPDNELWYTSFFSKSACISACIHETYVLGQLCTAEQQWNTNIHFWRLI